MEGHDAVRAAYQRYYQPLVVMAYGLTGELEEAQDLVQEAFARALARPGSFVRLDSQEAWLRTVVLNLVRNRWHRRSVWDRLVRSGRIGGSPESVPAHTPDRLVLVQALQRLSRPLREAVVLHHVADLPVEEVAMVLEVPVGTVKSRLSRGRAALATLLADDDLDRSEVEPLVGRERKYGHS